MINLCFVTDEGYSMPTGVTIYSILENKKENTEYNIYILCKDVSDRTKKMLSKLDREGFKLFFIDCNKDDYSDLYIEGIPATPTSIYKFFIPNILNDLDKVLYLDGDMVTRLSAFVNNHRIFYSKG